MADRVGQQLGNYRLTNLLGRGGFAEVYLSEHVYLKTQAAVKVLQTRLSNAEDLEGFLKEAQTVAHLLHPHIVRVLDFGVDGETPFLVMDYASNCTLRQLHKKGDRLPVANVVEYVNQIADALQHAHDEKFVHRDVKPENMLIDKRGNLLLSDFGIALVAQSSRNQSTQDIVGTVAYMSPEQIQGHPRPASDQYSLAIVVYEWLCGSRPFNGSFTELCTQHMFAPVPLLRAKIPDLSPEVEEIVTTALAKDPKQRFGSIRAFATALEQADQPRAYNVRKPSSTPSRPVSRTRPDDFSSRWPEIEEESEKVPVRLSSLSPLPSPGLEAQLEPDYFAPSSEVFPLKEQKEQRVAQKFWSIGKTQMIAATAGVLLYGLLQYLLNTLNMPPDMNSSQLFLPSPYMTNAQWITLFDCALLVPFFIGARFGPWSGLATASVGLLIADIFSGMFHPGFWTLYLLWGIFFGLTPGFILATTKGRYTASRAIIPTLVISLSALILGAMTIATLGGDTHFGFYFIPGFLLIPLSLVLSLFCTEKIAQSITDTHKR